MQNELTVIVTYDPDSSMWIAECSALHLATEASSYEALIERVWMIAPEMFHENGLPGKIEDLRLSFLQAKTQQPVLA